MRLGLICALVIGRVVLAGAPPRDEDRATRSSLKAELPALAGPLGSVTGLVQKAGTRGGTPADEKLLITALPRCDTKQMFFITRLVSSAALAASQIQSWMEKIPGLERRLFGRTPRLVEAARRAGHAGVANLTTCGRPRLADLGHAPDKACPVGADADLGSIFWYTVDGKPLTRATAAAAASVEPGPENGDACAPRMTAVLFDARGNARLRYLIDDAGAVSAQLLGNRCQRIDFTFRSETSSYSAIQATGGAGCITGAP